MTVLYCTALLCCLQVWAQGDKSSHTAFLTIHDCGGSYLDWVAFFNHEDMQATRDRCPPG